MPPFTVPVENLTLGQLAHLVEQARKAGASDDAPVTVDAHDDTGPLADPYRLEIEASWARTGPTTVKLMTTHHVPD